MANYDDTVMGWAKSPKPTRKRPDPEPRRWLYPFVSVDDHLVEPPDTFTGRLPARFADRAPRVERADGVDWWVFENTRVGLPTGDAHMSWDPSDWGIAFVTFDDMRRGTWDVDERVRDMDLAGISVSLNFPSTVFGFCGHRFLRFADRELGLASMRAYNDWVIEGWVGRYPERFIAGQVAWLADPVVAAAEIRRNADRGFRAVSFTENPERLGLPSLYSGAWDPFFAACAETQTVVNLHVGSSSETLVPSKESPPQVLGALFPLNAMQACLDWIFAKIPLRFPDLKIVLSESGIGWVPMVIDRLRYQEHVYDPAALGREWAGAAATPEECLRRNFWFTSYYDPLGLRLRDAVGVEHIMLEADYPHADSTWPDCQEMIEALVGEFPDDECQRLTHKNAAAVYRHEVPDIPAGRAPVSIAGGLQRT